MAPWVALAIVIAVLDQFSKQWVLDSLSYGQRVPVTSFFDLVLVFNPGAAFSFLANSGGVIGSYFEWVQDLAGFFWTEEEYNDRLIPIMKDNFKRVWDYAQEHNVKMRRAAFLVAIKRVADGLKIKGFFL